MLNPTSFYSVLTPTFYTTKLLGLTPFNINSKWCKFSKIDLCWSILFMVFISGYASTAIETSGGISSGIIANVTKNLDSFLGMGGMCFGILFGCINLKAILSVLQNLQAFDKKVAPSLHVNLKKEYQRSKIYSIIGLVTTLLFTAMSITYTTMDSTDLFTFELLGEYISYTAPCTINSYVDLQFCTIALCLKQRFAWLNKRIFNVSRNLECSLQKYDNVLGWIKSEHKVRPTTPVVISGLIQDQALYIMEGIRMNHYQLCTICKTLNKAYSVQILFIVLQNFITIIASLYYAGKYVIIDHIIPVDYIIYASVQLSLAAAQTMALVVCCSLTTEEARRTGVHLHNVTATNDKIGNRCKKELQLEISFFSLQLLHHNVEFTACKIFVIDESLIFSIVGAITTYLVIVIQFESQRLKA